MLCEDGGFTYHFRVHTGKDTVVKGNRNLTISKKIVEDLMLPLLNKGYHLYVDIWYTIITLRQYLKDNDTLVCDTIRKNRKGFPDAVGKAKFCQQGELIAYRSDALLALKFRVRFCFNGSLYFVSNRHCSQDSGAHTTKSKLILI